MRLCDGLCSNGKTIVFGYIVKEGRRYENNTQFTSKGDENFNTLIISYSNPIVVVIETSLG